MILSSFGGLSRKAIRTNRQAFLPLALLLLSVAPIRGATQVDVDVKISALVGEHPCPESDWVEESRPKLRDMLQNRWPFKLWDFRVAATPPASLRERPVVRAVVEFTHHQATAGFQLFAAGTEPHPRASVIHEERTPTACGKIEERLKSALDQKESELKAKLLENIYLGLGVEPGPDGNVILHAPPEVGYGVFRIVDYRIDPRPPCLRQGVSIEFSGMGCHRTDSANQVLATKTGVDPTDCQSFVHLDLANLRDSPFYLYRHEPEGVTAPDCRDENPTRRTPAPTIHGGRER